MTCQPQSVSCFTAPMMRGLSLSLTDTKTRLVVGRRSPAPSCAFAKARLKLLSIPMTSPVDFIRSEEHTSELQSLMRISYAVFCLKKKKKNNNKNKQNTRQVDNNT